MARLDRIALVAHGAGRLPVPGVVGDDPVSFHKIDSAFNASPLNFFANQQKIGIVEPTNACGIYEEHEAFSALSPQSGVNTSTQSSGRIHYQLPPTFCTADTHCIPCGGKAKCIMTGSTSGYCAEQHGSEVASVISASAGSTTPRAAGKATLYFPNDGGGSDLNANDWVACSPEATENAYSWLHDNDVLTVNESFVCRTAGNNEPCSDDSSYEIARDNEGITQDWYARHRNILVVKIPGNNHCDHNDIACPYTLNGVCVGGNRFADPPENATMSCFSSFKNPGTQWAPEVEPNLYGDREEPDLTALAGEGFDPFSYDCPNGPNEYVRVLDIKGAPVDWDGAHGTSVAAPAVTAMAALAREACAENYGTPLDARFLRSLLKTAAWGGNPDGQWRYSTQVDPPLDRRDGAGMLLANGVVDFCGSGNTNTGGGWLGVDLNDDDEFPGTHGEYQETWTPPGETTLCIRCADPVLSQLDVASHCARHDSEASNLGRASSGVAGEWQNAARIRGGTAV